MIIVAIKTYMHARILYHKQVIQMMREFSRVYSDELMIDEEGIINMIIKHYNVCAVCVYYNTDVTHA